MSASSPKDKAPPSGDAVAAAGGNVGISGGDGARGGAHALQGPRPSEGGDAGPLLGQETSHLRSQLEPGGVLRLRKREIASICKRNFLGQRRRAARPQ